MLSAWPQAQYIGSISQELMHLQGGVDDAEIKGCQGE